MIGELNAFYLKYLLWIPPAHWINIARITFHALAGAAAVREVYQYFSDLRCLQLGAQAWLAFATILTEALICVKFGRNEFPNPAPRAVVIFWSTFTALLILYPIWQFYVRPKIFTALRKTKAE